jgi:tyrosine-protein kinase Etk/Wzc
MNGKESNLLDYFAILVKWRWLIVVNFLIVCAVAAGASLIMPKVYTAQTTILPPREESGEMGLSSLLSTFPVSGFGFGAVSEQANLFLAILNSRTVMEAVAREFNLMERYKTKNMEETVRALQKRVSIEVNEIGTISVRVQAATSYLATEGEVDEARELAKNLANFYIEELDRVNTRLKVEKAHNTRIFIEERYHQNQEDLRRAEVELKKFQEKYSVIALPEQTAAAITTAATLKAEIITKEVEIGVLSKYVSASHPELVKAQSDLHELQEKYNELIYGQGADENVGKEIDETNDIFLPFKEVPDIGLQYARLFREVTLQQKISEFLLPQYEQAKIQEAKETPTVQVLDLAAKPMMRTKPKRKLFVLSWGGLSIIFTLLFVFSIEYWKRRRKAGDDDYQKIAMIGKEVMNDLKRIRRIVVVRLFHKG